MNYAVKTFSAIGPETALTKPTENSIAIVVGGAESVWREVSMAITLCRMAHAEMVFYVVNSAIALFRFPGIGVTLQPYPVKIGEWLRQRDARKLPALSAVWANRFSPGVTNIIADRKGSSGLAAVDVALFQNRHRRVLLCGVPMTKAGMHFERGRPWAACDVFLPPWRDSLHTLRQSVRSFGGWTAENLGYPNETFLAGDQFEQTA